MRVAWKPALAGLLALGAGAWLAARGWAQLMDEGPASSGLAPLTAGVLLALLGALLVAVPLAVPVLYRLYGEAAFTSRGAACPVVARCARCGTFNFRGRAACKDCGTALVWQATATGPAP
jgi:hypothetical protein